MSCAAERNWGAVKLGDVFVAAALADAAPARVVAVTKRRVELLVGTQRTWVYRNDERLRERKTLALGAKLAHSCGGECSGASGGGGGANNVPAAAASDAATLPFCAACCLEAEASTQPAPAMAADAGAHGAGLQLPCKSGGIFKCAAAEVLRREQRLMSTGAITRRALELGLLGTLPGKTPDATMASALYTDIKKGKGRAGSYFVRPCEGLFGLREWADDPALCYLLNEASGAAPWRGSSGSPPAGGTARTRGAAAHGGGGIVAAPASSWDAPNGRARPPTPQKDAAELRRHADAAPTQQQALSAEDGARSGGSAAAGAAAAADATSADDAFPAPPPPPRAAAAATPKRKSAWGEAQHGATKVPRRGGADGIALLLSAAAAVDEVYAAQQRIVAAFAPAAPMPLYGGGSAAAEWRAPAAAAAAAAAALPSLLQWEQLAASVAEQTRLRCAAATSASVPQLTPATPPHAPAAEPATLPPPCLLATPEDAANAHPAAPAPPSLSAALAFLSPQQPQPQQQLALPPPASAALRELGDAIAAQLAAAVGPSPALLSRALWAFARACAGQGRAAEAEAAAAKAAQLFRDAAWPGGAAELAAAWEAMTRDVAAASVVAAAAAH